jgi:hypothetical protein
MGAVNHGNGNEVYWFWIFKIGSINIPGKNRYGILAAVFRKY